MSTMSIIFDLITVAVVVITIWSSAAKGFVRSVIELGGFIASFIVAGLLSVPLGGWIYEHMLKSFFAGNVSGYISSLTGGTKQAFNQLLGSYNINSSALDGAVKSGSDAVNSAVSSQAGSLGSIVGRGIAFLIIFMLCLFLVRIIAHAADIINKLPVIGGINRLGGALIGVVKAVIVMFLLCTIVAVLIPVFAVQKNPTFTNTTVNSTYVFKYIYNINPVGILLKN